MNKNLESQCGWNLVSCGPGNGLFDFESGQLHQIWLGIVVDKVANILDAVQVCLAELMDNLLLLEHTDVEVGLEPLEVICLRPGHHGW